MVIDRARAGLVNGVSEERGMGGGVCCGFEAVLELQFVALFFLFVCYLLCVCACVHSFWP